MYDVIKKGAENMRKVPVILTLCVLMAGVTACGNRNAVQQEKSTVSTAEKESSIPDTKDGDNTESTVNEEMTEDTVDNEEITEDTAENKEMTGDSVGNGKTLVAYFAYAENMGDTSNMSIDAITSASLGTTDNTEGNLQLMAQVIQEKTNADMFHIVVQEPYDPSYEVMHDRAVDEIAQESLPALIEKVTDIDQYDVIYLGTPVWSGTLPRPVATFLTENNISQKTIIPFGINMGSGFGRIPNEIEKLCPDATLTDGFTIQAGTANGEVRSELEQWLSTTAAQEE